MNIDPFFDVNFELDSKHNQLNSNVGVVGFFLCAFDTIKGLQILFASPESLSESQAELSILKTHCIWKLDDIPIRIDLKFSEFVYSAFQLHPSIQKSSDNDVLYGVVLKLWKDNNPLDADAIYRFKTTLENDFKSDFDIIYKSKQLESNPVVRRKFNELQPKVREIKRSIIEKWEEFKGSLTQILSTPPKSILPTSDSNLIPSDAGVCVRDFFKDRIKLRIMELEENPDQLLVALENQSENLTDVKISISRSSDFFGEKVWEEEIKIWPMKEDLLLEFDKGTELERFLIKITSRNSTIAMKSIELNKN